MLTNREVSDLLQYYATLLDLTGDDTPHKVMAYRSAARIIENLPRSWDSYTGEELLHIKGIGKGIIQKLEEIRKCSSIAEIEKLQKRVPAGLLELMNIPGLGPKKIKTLYKELHITSPAELLYACHENRLVSLKGFGLKTQQHIKSAVEYYLRHKGFFLYAQIEGVAMHYLERLRAIYPDEWFEWTGAFRRKTEVLNKMEMLSTLKEKPSEAVMMYGAEEVPVEWNYADKEHWIVRLFDTTMAPGHLSDSFVPPKCHYEKEEDIYHSLGLPYIIPEMREGKQEWEWAKKYHPEAIVTEKEIKGLIHCHTTYSDGENTIEQMALAAREQGFQYVVISDHSVSAFYANGLSEERIEQQHKEIDMLNARLSPFRIFKGIEVDILGDGALDYRKEVLSTFEVVIASVHSHLKMDKEKATQRLIKAIENPYTHIIGHLTGRLLLVREGYPVDIEKIMDACAANGVCLELNANPYRLDIDWRYLYQCMEKGIMIAINPDAHSIAGISDIRYGIYAARKGGLLQSFVLNCLSLQGFSQWLRK